MTDTLRERVATDIVMKLLALRNKRIIEGRKSETGAYEFIEEDKQAVLALLPPTDAGLREPKQFTHWPDGLVTTATERQAYETGWIDALAAEKRYRCKSCGMLFNESVQDWHPVPSNAFNPSGRCGPVVEIEAKP